MIGTEPYKWEVFKLPERTIARPLIHKLPMQMDFMDSHHQVWRMNPETLKLEFIYSTSLLPFSNYL